MPFMPDVNSMLRTADTTVSGAETQNAGNALVIDLGPGSGINGLWWWIINPAAVTGTTPGYTVTLQGSNDKSSWTAITNPAAVTIVAAGEYGPFRLDDSAYRYISYSLTRGNADNSASAVSMGLTDRIMFGPR